MVSNSFKKDKRVYNKDKHELKKYNYFLPNDRHILILVISLLVLLVTKKGSGHFTTTDDY